MSKMISIIPLPVADLYRDQRLPSCQIVAVSPCGRRWQQFAGVAPPGKDQRPSPRARGPATPLTSRRESRATDLDALPLCQSHNIGRRDNMLKCIERECNLARPKVDWRMHRYYVELKKGIREIVLYCAPSLSNRKRPID